MATVTVRDLQQLATDALRGQGFPDADAATIAREFVAAEVAGVRTHGLGKIASMNLGRLDVEPTFEEHGAVVRVDGGGGSGFLVLRAAVRRCAATAERLGVGIAAVRNFSRYGSLSPYTEELAGRGLVGVLMNTAGPAAVAPFGASDPITGTNPICFSFPAADGVQTIDFATSETVWGEIRQAALEQRPLPDGSFLDAQGAVTTVPAEVNAVRAFGGAKGFALNLAVEMLAGLLTGAPAGLAVESEFDCGAVLIALRPEAFGAAETFPQLVSGLLGEVRNARPAAGQEHVRAPGDRARSRVVDDGEVEVADTTLGLLSRMAAGERISELSSNPLFN